MLAELALLPPWIGVRCLCPFGQRCEAFFRIVISPILRGLSCFITEVQMERSLGEPRIPRRLSNSRRKMLHSTARRGERDAICGVRPQPTPFT